jgi:hypothetical protein
VRWLDSLGWGAQGIPDHVLDVRALLRVGEYLIYLRPD